jgi:hypothetical protein
LFYWFKNWAELKKLLFLFIDAYRGEGEVGEDEGKYSTPLRQISKHLLKKT